MSMTSLEDRAFMHEIRELVRTQTTKYNQDSRYTTDGRRNLIAATYLAARKASDQAFEKYAAPHRARHQEIERKLFGPGAKDHAAIMSWRDACDRVDNLDGQEKAQRMFERACVSGDTMLAKAILQRAVRSAWNDLVDSAGTHMPEQAELVQEWLTTPSDTALTKIKAMVYGVPRPRELGNANDEQITKWADEAPAELAPERHVDQGNLGVATFSLSGPDNGIGSVA
ncbi:hypothetical protein [Nocardia sp. CA-119907]|uniref:hypothetical protein n=1 Tax=Nocardia sp. CA-119907 TaxID=3239973 RepID=UPI003D99DAF6